METSSTTANQAICHPPQEVVVRADNLGKCYRIYSDPKDRLKQAIARNSHQYYREFWALRHVDFELRRGETLGIIGRNGSGKSTLLQLLCGTLTPTEGERFTQGRIAALLELGSGFNPEFTGLENIYLYASLLGLTKQEIDNRLDAILSFADIGDCTRQPLKTYSSGMAVRLAFAVVANVDANLLIVDEALSVGDVFFVQKCMRFIDRFKQENTLILVTHDTQSVLSVCTHGLVLSEGRMATKMISAKKAIDAYIQEFYSSRGRELPETLIHSAPHPDDKANTNRGGPELKPTIRHGSTAFEGKVFQEILERSMTTALKEGRSVHGYLQESSELSEFGTKESRILSIEIYNINPDKSSLLAEGETVAIEIKAKCMAPITQPIFGFAIKNNNGLPVIGDNTFESGYGQRSFYDTGEIVCARFTFTLPRLPAGKYSVHAAIARGDQDDHVQMQYFHDICAFEVVSVKACHALTCPSDMKAEILPIHLHPS